MSSSPRCQWPDDNGQVKHPSLVGGWRNLGLDEKDSVMDHLYYALDALREQYGIDIYEPFELVRAQSQLVSGQNFRFQLEKQASSEGQPLCILIQSYEPLGNQGVSTVSIRIM